MSLFNLGGGRDSSSASQQGIWGLQAPYLQALYQNAFNTAMGQSGSAYPTAPGGTPDPAPVRPIPSPGHSGKGAIRQYEQEMAAWQARQQQAPAVGLQGQPGQATAGQGMPGTGQPMQPGPLPNITDASRNLSGNLFAEAQGQSPYLQSQIGNLGQNIGQFWNQQLLPGIANEAGGYGQYGGARQGIAQGLGAQQAIQSFQQGATDLYANNWNNAPQRATSLYNLGMAPYSAQFAPLQAFGGLLGGPAVLGSSSGGGGWNANVGFGGGQGGGGILPGGD